MVHGRIETTPAEQLIELRKARDRYAALADRLHESAPELDPEEKLAREQDARRIAQAYEKSITNSVVRMSSMRMTHRFAWPSLGVQTWLAIFVVISAVEGALLLAYFHPEIFQIRPATPQRTARNGDHPASAPIPIVPKPGAQQNAPPPVAAAPKSGAQQNAPPPVAAVRHVPRPVNPARPPPVAAAPKPGAQQNAPPPVVVARQIPQPFNPARPPPVAAAPIVQTPPPTAVAPIVQPETPPPVAAAQPGPPPPVALAVPAPPPLAPAAAIPPPIRLEPIAETHTAPPYPILSKRLGEAGITRMRVAISIQGAIAGCRILQTSGSERLDTVACGYVQGHWRWKPPMRDGQPATASADIIVVWNLKDAR